MGAMSAPGTGASDAADAPVDVVLFDLDGVIRHFDPDHREAVERRHGVEAGAIRATAFEPALLQRAITGVITTAEWITIVGESIGSPEAAREWSASRGSLDAEVLELINEIRSGGRRVAVLTNGTTEVTQEFVDLGLLPHVDAAFNTADIGFTKPDPRAFEHVCDAMMVEPQHVFFTDDTESKLLGAAELGMRTHHFTGLAELRRALARATGDATDR